MKQGTIFLAAILVCLFASAGWDSLKAQSSQASSTASSSNSGVRHSLASNLQLKLNHIEQNAAKPRPDQTPTVMTEDEVNDYLASGRVQLPQGVKKVRMEGRSGLVTAFLNVDFDQIRAGQRSSNPLMGLFSGTHDVQVEADAAGAGGRGKVHVRTVSIDGMEVPHMALEYFVNKYVTPKYPNIGLDSEFQMPDRVDTAVVGYHKLTVTQK
jgi:hypothetical protein